MKQLNSLHNGIRHVIKARALERNPFAYLKYVNFRSKYTVGKRTDGKDQAYEELNDHATTKFIHLFLIFSRI